MSYLQLAEDPYSHLAQDVMSNYIFIPAGYRGSTKDLYVREDFFDNLPESTYQAMMQELAQYQNTGLSSKASDRRDARKAKRTEKKSTKAVTREAKKEKRSARFGGVLDKVGGIVGNIIGGNKAIDITAGGGGLDIQYEEESSTWDRYKVPIIIGGIALVGGGIYLATRKKKR